MEKPKSLDSLFKEKIFRIPDYQRGYAWREEQFRSFWEDLVNLPEERAHYTGMLTLRNIPDAEIRKDSQEYWLVQDHSYKLYHVIDGQQRLTTFVIFIQALVENFARENKGKPSRDVYVTESLNLADLSERYLFRTNPLGRFRTYMFGYTEDNPSHEYLRHRILGESGSGTIQETFYTLNLGAAKEYFAQQLNNIRNISGNDGVVELYRKLTKRFMLNEYIIDDEFDVFVAFETMNNRGKKLSTLELLKNRLIYLTTLFSERMIDEAGRKTLRDEINAAWKETYHQLGRNKTSPLNDDEFLRSVWIVLFSYSRKTGRDYARYLLEDHFNPRKIHEMHGIDVVLEAVTERSEGDDEAEIDEKDVDDEIEFRPNIIHPIDVVSFVISLKQLAPYWFASWYPEMVDDLSEELRASIQGINRLGMGYFRPLVMVALRSNYSEVEKLRLFKQIERFIFLAFRVGTARSNYQSSVFYNAARALYKSDTNIDTILEQLDSALSYAFDEDGFFRIDEFYGNLFKKFKDGQGYYYWSGLRYFLFEYEQSLLNSSRQRKVAWNDLLKPGDKISIEHIYPQCPTEYWETSFTSVSADMRERYNASLGNLLLLSMSINSALQNDAFELKKIARHDEAGRKIRNGYSDGSHSEIEVAQNPDWGPLQIKERGIKLLNFMEERWKISFREADKIKLLFLDDIESEPPKIN